MSPTHSRALIASKPLAAAQPHATSVRPAADERLDPHRALGNGKPGISNTFTGTLPAGLSRLTKLKFLCVLQPTTLCTPAGSPCRLARGLVVSGRQESLRCRPTRQFSRRILRPSSVNYLVRSRPHSMRLHPTAWRAFGSASHTNKPSLIQAMEAARTSTAEGSHRCDVRLFKSLRSQGHREERVPRRVPCVRHLPHRPDSPVRPCQQPVASAAGIRASESMYEGRSPRTTSAGRCRPGSRCSRP